MDFKKVFSATGVLVFIVFAFFACGDVSTDGDTDTSSSSSDDSSSSSATGPQSTYDVAGTVNAASEDYFDKLKVGLLAVTNNTSSYVDWSNECGNTNIYYIDNQDQSTNAWDVTAIVSISGTGTTRSFSLTLPPESDETNYFLVCWYDVNENDKWDVVDSTLLDKDGHENSEYIRLVITTIDTTKYIVKEFWKGGGAQTDYIWSGYEINGSTTPMTSNHDTENYSNYQFYVNETNY